MIEYEKFKVWCEDVETLYAVANALDQMGYRWVNRAQFPQVVSVINHSCELRIGYRGENIISYTEERDFPPTREYKELSPDEILGSIVDCCAYNKILSSFDGLLEG